MQAEQVLESLGKSWKEVLEASFAVHLGKNSRWTLIYGVISRPDRYLMADVIVLDLLRTPYPPSTVQSCQICIQLPACELPN